jgi:ABC-type Zn uptake system ZnuABC Zn-binding protein ZnuA
MYSATLDARIARALSDKHPLAALTFTRNRIAAYKDELEQLYEVERALVNRIADERAAAE